MENTQNTIENQNNQLTGIWYIEGNRACRNTISIPITDENKDEIFYQIEQQNIARNLFEGFKKISNDNVDLVGYLHRILRDALNFLDDQRKEEFITRIENIKNSNSLDENNNVFLNYIIYALKENKFNIFMEVFEDFEKYNAASIIQPLTEIEIQTNDFHR